MERLGKGDVLVIKSIDRMGRNCDEMLKQLDIITREKEAVIVVLDLPLLNIRNKYGDDLTAKLRGVQLGRRPAKKPQPLIGCGRPGQVDRFLSDKLLKSWGAPNLSQMGARISAKNP